MGRSNVDRRGDTSKRKTLEFLVKWKYQDESKNSWEPYKILRYVEALHDYLRQNHLAHLIPKSIKEHIPAKLSLINVDQDMGNRMDVVTNADHETATHEPKRRGRPKKQRFFVESQDQVSNQDLDHYASFEEPPTSENQIIIDHGKRKRQRNRNIERWRSKSSAGQTVISPCQ